MKCSSETEEQLPSPKGYLLPSVPPEEQQHHSDNCSAVNVMEGVS